MKMKKISTLLMVPALAVSLAACGGSSKPSKANVEAGFKELFTMGAGGELSAEDKEQTDKLSSCITDKTHETMSAEGLQLIADADFENQSTDAITEDDQKALQDAMAACLQEAFPELGADK